MKKLMRNKLFLSMYVADMMSNFGDVVYYLTLMKYVLLLPDTKLALSLVTVSETIPIFTLLFAGVWADWTKNKVDTIIGTQFFRVLLYLLVGLVMGFEPALWIVLVASSINVVADIAGQYESMLYLPLSLRIVPQEDREAMVAFRRGFGSILQIIFRSSGAVLIGVMSYQALAFFNAGTFLISALIMFGLRSTLLHQLPAQPLPKEKDSTEKRQSKQLVKEFFVSLQKTYRTMQEIPALGFFTKMIALGNMTGIGSVLVVLMLKEDRNFALFSAAMTISLLMISQLAGSVVGSFLTTSLFQNVKLFPLLKWMNGCMILIYVAYFCHSIIAVLGCSVLAACLQGIFQPKMSAFFYQLVPEDQLATVGAGVDTISYLGMFVSQLLVSTLVLLLSATSISFVYILISCSVLGYTMFESKRLRKVDGD